MKRVRLLLRVSSNQQLETDGDLSVQREIILSYIRRHEDWILDGKEYFEGSNSGYKNSVCERDVLQEALNDAKRQEYDILVVYKDDRIGRRMWEIGTYINQLSQQHVNVYTTVDDCITPAQDDMMGQLMLAFRFNAAEKSSRDTGVRVRDSAIQLVKKGKFMGGKPPYGYQLVYSGQISKHGRALKELVIIPERAQVVQYIYHMYLHAGFGALKLAKMMNKEEQYRSRALDPQVGWRAGTITGILMNPLYFGYAAYKKRISADGAHHRLNQSQWVMADECNTELAIVDAATWHAVQQERKRRADYYHSSSKKEGASAQAKRGNLLLLDVIYCGYCGGRLTNGTRYSYWTIKETGERRRNRMPAYKCIRAVQGEQHDDKKVYGAKELEERVMTVICTCIARMQEKQDLYEAVLEQQQRVQEKLERQHRMHMAEQKKMKGALQVLIDRIPDAMTAQYVLSIEELHAAIARQREKIDRQSELLNISQKRLRQSELWLRRWKDNQSCFCTWEEVLQNTEEHVKRTLVKKIVERIEVQEERILIRFRITLEELLE